MVLVGGVDLFVFGLVGRIHVPVKPIFKTWRVIFIFYPFELLLATQSTGSVDEMGLGFRDEPIGQDGGDILKFLLNVSPRNFGSNLPVTAKESSRVDRKPKRRCTGWGERESTP